ncbi:hypothetical protein KI387_013130, partial [Taxus chinensis]
EIDTKSEDLITIKIFLNFVNKCLFVLGSALIVSFEAAMETLKANSATFATPVSNASLGAGYGHPSKHNGAGISSIFVLFASSFSGGGFVCLTWLLSAYLDHTSFILVFLPLSRA